jgi:putative transposase
VTKKSTEAVAASSPTWETLETFARHGMQQFLQRVLEAEVDELLARGRYERRAAVDAPVGHRNGFGKPRRLSLSNGTITLRRPRVRGLSERFESRLLPAFKRHGGGRAPPAPSSTSTASPRATSIWPCAGCSAMARRCRRLPARG